MNSKFLKENEIYFNENDELCLNCGRLYSHVEVGNYPFEFNDKGIVRCYGISQYPQTKEYVMVLELMMVNLCDWLNSDYNKHNWVDNLFLLNQLIKGLNNIHMKGLIHRDFHPGNLLMREISSKFAYISDLGLSGPVDNERKSNGEIFGVLPYLPPEVLLGMPYTQAADIYGLGMIMYLIATGNQPFNDVAHDYLLSIDICKGIRPKIKREEIPLLYYEIMESCWDQDPSKRKSSKELYQLSSNWFLHKKLEIKDEIKSQLKVYDGYLSKNYADKQKQQLCHSQAIYTSRLLCSLTQPLR
ncbi:17591_t:CDS:2 [Funneliformis geosporum]|uniref:17591_t:CDS:1 n=1 Tax=Funneliformis geosporum TaxID=1117311 RepID=A0A9W4WV54_9GLOM|nr:17591_t:CDS:2 [Funneliformis geosporum]